MASSFYLFDWRSNGWMVLCIKHLVLSFIFRVECLIVAIQIIFGCFYRSFSGPERFVWHIHVLKSTPKFFKLLLYLSTQSSYLVLVRLYIAQAFLFQASHYMNRVPEKASKRRHSMLPHNSQCILSLCPPIYLNLSMFNSLFLENSH